VDSGQFFYALKGYAALVSGTLKTRATLNREVETVGRAGIN